MAIKRRTVLKGMLATGVSAATLKMPAVHAQAAPFKIGLLTVKTGPLAQGGIQMEQGIVTFLKEKNQTLAGRKVDPSWPTPEAIPRAPEPRPRRSSNATGST